MIRAVPGPEMDAAVAEHVMGWIYHPPSADTEGVAWWEVPEGDPTRDRFGSADWPPCYSTDIAAAWPVLEKLRLKYTTVKIFAQNGWSVALGLIHADGGEVWTVLVNAPTAPLAICKAALKAKGVNVE